MFTPFYHIVLPKNKIWKYDKNSSSYTSLAHDVLEVCTMAYKLFDLKRLRLKYLKAMES